MPSYVATHSAFYGSIGGPDSGGTFGSGTFSDGNNDEWTIGEALTETAPQTITLGGAASFAGTVEVNGKDYPVIDLGYGFVILYDDVTDFGATPATLPTPDTSSAFTACFAEGTLIATPGGDVPVDTLRIGDSVLNETGESVAVKWVGRQSILTVFTPAERVRPVRFAPGSLGNGLPHTDLTVTADHGILVDGVICHAGALVNGTTITRVPLEEMGQRYTVYHIETENHEIILANGAPAETFIDSASRRAFDNYAEFEALYGNVPEMEELPYPRAMSARQVPAAIKRKLAGRRAA